MLVIILQDGIEKNTLAQGTLSVRGYVTYSRKDTTSNKAAEIVASTWLSLSCLLLSFTFRLNFAWAKQINFLGM